MTIEALLARGRQRLAPAAQEAAPVNAVAWLDAEALLAQVLEVPRARLRSHPETAVQPMHAQRFLNLIDLRARGMPLAYILGRREFWSLELRVTSDVLIPRPETELLVERALALAPAAACSVADLGTGSGAIALALAHERPQWRVLATDVSAAALRVARSNARAHGLERIEFLEGSWFEPLGTRCFELLVSNPPYIAAADPALADPALADEPRLALSPGWDGLAHLRILARGAAAHLTAGGWLMLEHGATQGEAVRAELVAAGFAHVRSHRDLAGHERTTEGQR